MNLQTHQEFERLFQFCQTPIELIIKKLSNQLNHQLNIQSITSFTTTSDSDSSHLSKFQAEQKPTITIHAYLTRLITLAPISIDSILLALLYLNRSTTLSINLIQSISSKSTSDLPIIPYHLFTIHRLLLSTLMVANKFISDHFLSASRASKVGGVPIPELASLERSLLYCLDFDLNFTMYDLNQVAEWVLTNDVSITPQVNQTEKMSQTVQLPIINIEQLELKDQDEVQEDQKPINSPPTLSISHFDSSPQFQSCSQTSSDSLSSSSQLQSSSQSSFDSHSALQLHSRSQSISISKPIPNPQSISRSQSISHTNYNTNPSNNPNQTVTPRRRRVFLRTHFVKDPRYNSNYLTTRPKVEEYETEELKNATRIILTKLDSNGLKIQTELLGVSLITGEKICRTMSTQSIPL